MNGQTVSLRFESFEAFLNACEERVSEDGVFLSTDQEVTVGETVRFDLGIDDEFPILRGSGEVVRVVDKQRGGPGLAVRFVDPDSATTTLARQIVSRQQRRSRAVYDLEGDEAVPIGTLDLPKLADDSVAPASPEDGSEASAMPTPTPTTAVDQLIVAAGEPGDDLPEEPVESATSEPDELPTELEADPGPVSTPIETPAEITPVHPWEMDPETTQKKSGGRLFWLLLVLLALLAAGGYWQRDALRGLVAGSSASSAETVALAEEPVTAEPATSAEEEAVVEPEAPTEAEPEPAPLEPLTRIDEIRWTSTAGASVLELVADGAFSPEGHSVERLSDPPRLVIKVTGVTAPLARANLAVGTSEIVGVRTGLHGTPPSSALHVVVDLADPTAQADDAQIDGARLRVRVASGAVDP